MSLQRQVGANSSLCVLGDRFIARFALALPRIRDVSSLPHQLPPPPLRPLLFFAFLLSLFQLFRFLMGFPNPNWGPFRISFVPPQPSSTLMRRLGQTLDLSSYYCGNGSPHSISRFPLAPPPLFFRAKQQPLVSSSTP